MSALAIAISVAAAVSMWCVLLALGAKLRRVLRLPVGGALRWSVYLSLGAWATAITATIKGLV